MLCVDGLYWTHDVAAAIVRGTLGALAKRLTSELLQARALLWERRTSCGGAAMAWGVACHRLH